MNEHDAIARIKRLSHNINCADEIWNCADEIAEVIERLINERDEARREAATFYARQFYKDDAVDRMSRIYAEECGWDCFKDNA